MNIQTKNKGLVLSFIAFLFLGYFFSITDTLALKANYNELSREAQLFSNVPERLQNLKLKEQYYDSLMTKYKIADISLQNSLFKSVKQYARANNLELASFSQPHIFSIEERVVKSYPFTVSGSFRDILGTAYHLEQKSEFGKISNLHFEKKSNFRTQEEYLEGHFVLQIIE